MLLAGLALALPEVPFSADLAGLLSACAMALRAQYSTPGGATLSAIGAVLAATVVVRVGYCLVGDRLSTVRERSRQLDELALIARRDEGYNAMVVEHVSAAAYCLPGRRHQVVVTTGALSALSSRQLAAVLEHERAHQRGRHDLVLMTAAALWRAFPRVLLFRVAHGELTRLVEMRADDVAARGSDRRTIAGALVRLAEAQTPAQTPATALGAGRSASLARVRRLVAPARPLGAARSLLAAAAVIGVVATPLALGVAPAAAAATEALCPIDFRVQAQT